MTAPGMWAPFCLLLAAFIFTANAARSKRGINLKLLSREKGPQEAWRNLWSSGSAAGNPARQQNLEWCPSKKSTVTLADTRRAIVQEDEEMADNATSSEKLNCYPSGVVVGGLWSFKWKESCCTGSGLACSGCGVWTNDNGGKCLKCAPGYSKHKDVCVACDDIVGWVDADGLTCSSYEEKGLCSGGRVVKAENDTAFQGISPSQACCACGGGETTPTPFRYPTSREVFTYGDNVWARPSPITARRHSLDPDCRVNQLGIGFHADGKAYGQLPQYVKGMGSVLSETCTVTALQDELNGLESSAPLTVTVQAFSYGTKIITFRFKGDLGRPTGKTSWDLTLSDAFGKEGFTRPLRFEISCMPAAPWVKVNKDSGRLYYDTKARGRTAGIRGAAPGMWGSQCVVSAKDPNQKEMQISIYVMKVFLWTGAYYPQTPLARKGRPIKAMEFWRKAPKGYEAKFSESTGDLYWVKMGKDADGEKVDIFPALRPAVKGVECKNAKWSKKTGVVTIKGQAAFTVDPESGDVSGVNQVDLPAQLGKASKTVECVVAIGGEAYDTTINVPLSVQLEDDTCWYESAATEPVWARQMDSDSGKDCSLECLSKKDCGMYWTEGGNCYIQTSARTQAMSMTPTKVRVRSNCEEGSSCLELKDSGARFLEGHYCPKVRQQSGHCFHNLYQMTVFLSKPNGFIMYSMRLVKRRFGVNVGGQLIFVYGQSGRWNTIKGPFTPESTDVLMAEVKNYKVTSLQGVAGVSNGMRRGFAAGTLTYSAPRKDKGGKWLVIAYGDGKFFQSWECAGISTAVFSRNGANAWDEFFMARAPCPIRGHGGTWVVRRANKTDFVNPEDGKIELRGDVLACIEDDVEYEAFRGGVSHSTMWLPSTAFKGSDASDYEDQKQRNDKSELSITATLTTDSCRSPDANSDFTWGTVSTPALHTLDPCECFGEAFKDADPVTQESRQAITNSAGQPFNQFNPSPQLLLEGPYSCEDSSVLQHGQLDEISEEQCAQECEGTTDCQFFMYVPQLRFCTLHQSCERLGHTGLDLTHRLFGIFDRSRPWCRIADPEVCWAKKHRRALLEGTIKDYDEPCAFQSILEQCDVLHMATTEAHGECHRCEYYPVSSEAGRGLTKRPLPKKFPGGAQLQAGCAGDARLLSLVSREYVMTSVITCVGGSWVDENGQEGLNQLTCSPCVQAAQPSYSEHLKASAPEVYFLGMRKLNYHFGVASNGCRSASETTHAKLVGLQELCLESIAKRPWMKASCSTTWYLNEHSQLVTGGVYKHCLMAGNGNGDFVFIKDCEDDNKAMEWAFDTMHRIRNIGTGKCLKSRGTDGGKPYMWDCRDQVIAPEYERWYFDGGDCRYSMQLRSADRPLTWRFQLHGGAVVGLQTSSPAKVPVLYQVMAKGESGCPSGLDIQSQDECKQALQYLGLPVEPRYVYNRRRSSPSRCSVYDGPLGASGGSNSHMYWCPYSRRRTRPYLAPVCRSRPSVKRESTIDPMAYSTCRASINGKLQKADMKSRELLELNYNGAQGLDVMGLRSLTFYDSGSGRELFSCAPGGVSGVELLLEMKQEKEQLEQQKSNLERSSCIPIKRTGSKGSDLMPISKIGSDWYTKRMDGVISRIQSWKKLTQITRPDGRRRRRVADRDWQVDYSGAKGLTNDRRDSAWSAETNLPFYISCPKGYVAYGMDTKFYFPAKEHDELREENRKFRLKCVKLGGVNWDAPDDQAWPIHTPPDWQNWLNWNMDANVPEDQYVVGMFASGMEFDNRRRSDKTRRRENKHGDRLYKFYTVKPCSKDWQAIEQKQQAINRMAAKIEDFSTSSVSCARDLDLTVQELQAIRVSYPGGEIGANMDMEVKCHLLHWDVEATDNQEDYALTASQFVAMARASAYHAVPAGDHQAKPFESKTGAASAQKVGWFSIIDNGATTWGLLCKPGSVVAVNNGVNSPFCTSVGAGVSQGDVVVESSVPGSSRCNTGYAVGGWYNLPGLRVRKRSDDVGGPSETTGYQLYCRQVPGLSRLCEEREERCEQDEVVTGLQHELGLTIKYRCCKFPKTVGHVFAGNKLFGTQPWEGYYCPAKLDDTGRPSYTLQRPLGVPETKPSQEFAVVPRSTPLWGDGGGKYEAWKSHRVYCKGGEVLNQFKVERGGVSSLNMIRASYTCLKLPLKPLRGGLRAGGCVTRKTNEKTRFVDLSVHCSSSDHALAGIQLQTRRLGSSLAYSYSYTCCQVDIKYISKKSYLTTWTKGASTITDLADQNVACPSQNFMTGFDVRWNSNGVWHELWCATIQESSSTSGTDASRNLAWDKFTGTWKLWKDNFAEPEAALDSPAASPIEASSETPSSVRIDPKGFAGNDQAKFWLNGEEIKADNGHEIYAVVLEPGARRVAKLITASTYFFRSSYIFSGWFNDLPERRVVLLSFSAEEMKKLDGRMLFCLQRLGATLMPGDRTDSSYALVGIIGGGAIAESKPNDNLIATVPQLSITPIVSFDASFVSAVESPKTFPETKPQKPELIKFAPEKPKYDQFCDLATRNFLLDGVDCEEPGACPPDFHPCAHAYKEGITEQKFWGCHERESTRTYLKHMVEVQGQKLQAANKQIERRYELIESGVTLAAAAIAAIPWGSYAVPATEGAEESTGVAEIGAKKMATEAAKTAAKETNENMLEKVMHGTLGKAMKKSSNSKFGDFIRYLGWDDAATVNKHLGFGKDAASAIMGKTKADELDEASRDAKDELEETWMLEDGTAAVPEMFPPDDDGFNAATNYEALWTADYKDCQPLQVGLSKMMCDLYCVESSVKQGDKAILSSIQTSHNVLMANLEKLLEYHTQTILWGLGQLKTGSGGKLLFLHGQPGDAGAQKLPDDVANALQQLDTLPKLLNLDLSGPGRNASLPPDTVAWHAEASERLWRALHRTLEKDLRPGGNVTEAAAQAKGLVQRFAQQRHLRFSAAESSSRHHAHVAEMTQWQAAKLRRQIREAKELLEMGTPEQPPVDMPHQDPSVMAWYAQVTSGFVAAHEQHAVFVQSRQRALKAAEAAVAAGEGYVSCGQQGLEDLQSLWQRAYRLEDQAVRDLQGAWASTSAAREKLTLAVQQGLVSTIAETVPLPEDSVGPCMSLQALAEHVHWLAVQSLDKTLWPFLEQVLALERLADLQEHELESKGISLVARQPLNSTILALHAAARDGANPASRAGRHLAARALTALGPSSCPAPPSCRRGGMLLLNSSQLLWTSTTPGDLLLGKAAAEVAHACNPSTTALPAGTLLQQFSQQVVGAGNAGAGSGGLQSTLVLILNKLNDLTKLAKTQDAKLNKLDVDSQLCAGTCAEQLQLHLTRKKSAVQEILQRLR